MLINGIDKEATKKAGFYSKHSYVSFAGHYYLYGEVDHGVMRRKIYDRVKGMCQGCPTPHFVDYDFGEWHHAQKTYGGKRCDGLCCAMWVCKKWHKEHHGLLKYTCKRN